MSFGVAPANFDLHRQMLNSQLEMERRRQEMMLAAIGQRQQRPYPYSEPGWIGAISPPTPVAPQKAVEKPKEKKKVSMLRDYLNKHRDVFFTLALAVLVDHFVLNGALRSRIQRVVEAALDRVAGALGLPPEKAGAA